MPTNQQRREAAKRKLERQLVRRAQRERQRRQRLIVVGAIAAVLVVVGIVFLIERQPSASTATTSNSSTGASGASGASDASEEASTSAAPALGCKYTADGTAAKKVDPPSNTLPANTGTVTATLTLNGQAVPLTLDRKAAPCTVNSFVSLAGQKYFDGTTCHRETATASLSVLQCGDPTATGSGTPGYSFADELTSIPGYSATSTASTVTYKRGTLAMANAGADTNGSQFFLVYKDSTLPPAYTVFGSISDSGLKVIDAIAAKGVAGGQEDGKPAATVTITSVTVPSGAVTATGSYAAPSSADAGLSGASAVPSASAGGTPAATSTGSAATTSTTGASTTGPGSTGATTTP